MNVSFSSVVIGQIAAHAQAGDLNVLPFQPTLFNNAALPTTGLSDTLTIDNDGAYCLYAINGSVFQPAGTYIANPDILVNIQNAGSGRYMSKTPMAWVTTVGTAQNPFWFPEPLLLPANSQVLVALTNNSGGSYAEVNMTWVGVKLRLNGGFSLDDLAMPVDFAYTR